MKVKLLFYENPCHHKFKKLFEVTLLSIVKLGFNPRHTDFKYISKLYCLCCYKIKSPDFKTSKSIIPTKQKCSIGTAENNGMWGMNPIYPFPTFDLEKAVN